LTRQTKYRFGKKRAVHDSRTLKFGAYVKPSLPPPPAARNYGDKVARWPMYLNDKYGDCTCAAAAHMIECWTANAGGVRLPSDEQVLEFYEHFTEPGPENGCNMLDVLKYWRAGGLGGDQIDSFAALDRKNATEVRDAVYLFGGCYIGLELPDFVLNADDPLKVAWAVPPQGPVGAAAPDPDGGHCVPAVGYDTHNLYVVTWGAVKAMSWQFYIDYADESYAVLSQDFLRHGKTPDGFNLAQLKQDLAAIATVPAAKATVFSLQ
jgi:hypothetical protein